MQAIPLIWLLLAWDLPAAQSLTTSVKKAVSDTLTIVLATVN
jgi:hypothetical protein